MLGVLKSIDGKLDVPVFNVQNEQIEQEIIQRSKPSKQLEKAMDWIRVNDPDYKLTVREAARLASVSVGTMHKARE